MTGFLLDCPGFWWLGLFEERMSYKWKMESLATHQFWCPIQQNSLLLLDSDSGRNWLSLFLTEWHLWILDFQFHQFHSHSCRNLLDAYQTPSSFPFLSNKFAVISSQWTSHPTNYSILVFTTIIKVFFFLPFLTLNLMLIFLLHK